MQAPGAPDVLRETAFDEVFDSQRTFRVLLEAMSRPGRVCALPRPAYRGAPRGLVPPALTVLKTLCDHRVSFAVVGAPAGQEWVRYLAVNTGARPGQAGEADYALFDGAAWDDGFSLLKRGLPEFPERSATALFSVQQLQGGDGPSPPGGVLLRMAGSPFRPGAWTGATCRNWRRPMLTRRSGST
jgi:phosphonate C-P lyase system protein PhnH